MPQTITITLENGARLSFEPHESVEVPAASVVACDRIFHDGSYQMITNVEPGPCISDDTC